MVALEKLRTVLNRKDLFRPRKFDGSIICTYFVLLVFFQKVVQCYTNENLIPLSLKVPLQRSTAPFRETLFSCIRNQSVTVCFQLKLLDPMFRNVLKLVVALNLFLCKFHLRFLGENISGI